MRFFRGVPRVGLAQAGEAPALADLYRLAWEDCRRPLDPRLVEEQTASLAEVEAWLRGGFEVYRAVHDGRVAGAVRCSFPTSTCHLDRLAVRPELRRRGFGHALVDHAIGRARRAGVARVWVQLSPKLGESVALFRGLGFREAGRHHAGYWGESLILLELPI